MSFLSRARAVLNPLVAVSKKQLSTAVKTSKSKSWAFVGFTKRPQFKKLATFGTAAGTSTYYFSLVAVVKADEGDDLTSKVKDCLIPSVHAAKSQNCYNTQCNIIDPRPYMYSLYLWINLDCAANPRLVAKVAADVEGLVETVSSPTDDCCEDIVAGVGFGPNFYSQVMGKTCRNFYYTPRKGLNGEMPYTPGDIFLHAKCNNKGKLFDLCKNYITSFPEGSIQDFEDIYGFDFRNNCDLSGFRLVTNRPDECGRRAVAVEQETGGSYALAQKWIHDFCVIRPENRSALEKYIGRDMETSAELKNKQNSSHVARMRGTTELLACPQYECVMAAQNWGTLSTDAGSFVLAFAADPCAFEFMLDRMVGAGCDTCCDDVMKMSKNVKGTYWYFPAVHELCHLVNSEPC